MQCPVLEFDTIRIARWLVRGVGLGSDGRTKFDGPFSGWVGTVQATGLSLFFRAARNSLWEFMTLIFGEW